RAGVKSRNRLLSNALSCNWANGTVETGAPDVTARSLSLCLSLILKPNFRKVAAVALDPIGVRTFNAPVTSRSLDSKISVCQAFSVATAGLSDDGLGWMFVGSIDAAE